MTGPYSIISKHKVVKVGKSNSRMVLDLLEERAGDLLTKVTMTTLFDKVVVLLPKDFISES